MARLEDMLFREEPERKKKEKKKKERQPKEEKQLAQPPQPVYFTNLLEKADEYYDQEQWDSAISYYRKFLKEKNIPNELISEAHESIASCYLQKNNFDMAMEEAKKALHHDDTNAYAWHIKAMMRANDTTMKKSTRLKKALRCINNAVQLEPQDAYLRYWKGILLLDNIQPMRAQYQFKKAIELDPDNIEYRNMLQEAKKDTKELTKDMIADIGRGFGIGKRK